MQIHVDPSFTAGEGPPLRMEYEDAESEIAGEVIHRLVDPEGNTVARGPRSSVGALWAEHERLGGGSGR